MKATLFSIIFVAVAAMFTACNNGDYVAQATSPANQSVNPMNVLDSAGFNWTGADAISANINGQYYHIDSSQVTFSLVSGTNVINGFTGVAHGFHFELSNVYSNNIYDMGYKITERFMEYVDSPSTGPVTYHSYLGNVGQVQIIRNDPDRIIGRFHFQALDQIGGKVINVSNGWFNIGK